MTKWWRKVECNGLCIVVVCFLCGIPLGFMGNMALERLVKDERFPVEFHKVEALNSPVQQGGFLKTRIFRDKRRDDCTVKSERYATRSDGFVLKLPDMIWEGGEAGTEYLDFAYDVSALYPGSYVLHVYLTYLCDGGTRVFAVEQPPVAFEVAA